MNCAEHGPRLLSRGCASCKLRKKDVLRNNVSICRAEEILLTQCFAKKVSRVGPDIRKKFSDWALQHIRSQAQHVSLLRCQTDYSRPHVLASMPQISPPSSCKLSVHGSHS
ncbi:Piso0_004824 [Millerozyma farinosa CBS 7064]|uniref:Piso0_004824 protein n=1 Tax=Pichia sorbitophila (strain ATCC MYA-4447 / BCRC 22081 / CBS 7064 / NBRC 10061 / NRRL Y-12695) TaxID=559304 RepID=G8Y3H4_PICSO|nr:Piso0_004824 [Millerozyma farinosa CBS 7064]